LKCNFLFAHLKHKQTTNNSTTTTKEKLKQREQTNMEGKNERNKRVEIWE
jgi:hypothetical protein